MCVGYIANITSFYIMDFIIHEFWVSVARSWTIPGYKGQLILIFSLTERNLKGFSLLPKKLA